MKAKGGGYRQTGANELGERIRKVRTKVLKVSATSLGQQLGVTAGAVSNWERGENDAGDEKLRHLAATAQVSYDWLTGDRRFRERALELADLLNMLSDDDADDIMETFEILLHRHFERAQMKSRPKKD